MPFISLPVVLKSHHHLLVPHSVQTKRRLAFALSTESGNQAGIKLLFWITGARCAEMFTVRRAKEKWEKWQKLLSFYTRPHGTCPSLISQPRLLSSYYPVITEFEQKSTSLLVIAKTDFAWWKEGSKVSTMMLALYSWSHNRNWLCFTTESGNQAGIKLLL